MSDSCDPMGSSLPGSSVCGISQARIVDWVAVLFFRGSSDLGTEPRSPALQADSLPTELPGKQGDNQVYLTFFFFFSLKFRMT